MSRGVHTITLTDGPDQLLLACDATRASRAGWSIRDSIFHPLYLLTLQEALALAPEATGWILRTTAAFASDMASDAASQVRYRGEMDDETRSLRQAARNLSAELAALPSPSV